MYADVRAAARAGGGAPARHRARRARRSTTSRSSRSTPARITASRRCVRWDHPQYGPAAAAALHPARRGDRADRARSAAGCCARPAAQVQALAPAYPTPPLSRRVNISGRQLHERDIVERRRASALADAGLDPRALMLEITESVLMQQTPRRCSSGCGSSRRSACASPSTTSAPATRRSATCSASRSTSSRSPSRSSTSVGPGPRSSALARAIIGLGETLKLRTIAEGVEMAEQRAALLDLGCDSSARATTSPPPCGPRPARAARASGAGCRLADA